MNKMKESKAITLISLMVTILVLLILAGVVIKMTVGNNNLIEKANLAVTKSKDAIEEENSTLSSYLEIMDGNEKVIASTSREQPWNGATMLTINISNITGGSFQINVNNVEANNYGKLYYYVNDTLVYSGTDKSYMVTAVNGEPIADNTKYKIQVLSEPYKMEITTGTGDNINSWLACIGNPNKEGYNIDNLDDLFANETLLYDLLNSEEGRNYFAESKNVLIPNAANYICSSDRLFRLVVNDSKIMTAGCEIKQWREAMYDNCAITEPLIANSSVALSAMMNSTQYASSATGNTNSYKMITVYSGKAFIFTCSAYSNQSYSIRLIAGYFINGNSTVQGKGSSGKTLTMNINKFASSVAGSRDGGWDGKPITMTYFKI